MSQRKQYEISTDGRTVWVNAPNCIGRFCRLSVEIGQNNEQGWAPANGTTRADWDKFVESMHFFHNIHVPEKYMPVRLRG